MATGFQDLLCWGGGPRKEGCGGAEFLEICLRILSHNYRGEQGTSTAGPEDRTGPQAQEDDYRMRSPPNGTGGVI
jgi:hypothetical protein